MFPFPLYGKLSNKFGPFWGDQLDFQHGSLPACLLWPLLGFSKEILLCLQSPLWTDCCWSMTVFRRLHFSHSCFRHCTLSPGDFISIMTNFGDLLISFPCCLTENSVHLAAILTVGKGRTLSTENSVESPDWCITDCVHAKLMISTTRRCLESCHWHLSIYVVCVDFITVVGSVKANFSCGLTYLGCSI